MAFNPFHRFRKHQRTIMAVLVVFCMVIFTFQFGRGDIMDRFRVWFGYKGQQGKQVTTLYGTKVYEADLGELATKRTMANEFVRIAIGNGFRTLGQEAKPALQNIPQVQSLIDNYERRQQFRALW